MPKYRVIVQETKSYFVEANNKDVIAENLLDYADADHEQSCTLDRCDIEEVIDVGSIVERFGTKDE